MYGQLLRWELADISIGIIKLYLKKFKAKLMLCAFSLRILVNVIKLPQFGFLGSSYDFS